MTNLIERMNDINELNANDKLELGLQCPYGLVAASKLMKSRLYKNPKWHPNTEGLLRIVVGLCVYGGIDNGHRMAIKMCNPSIQLLDSFWRSDYSADVRKNLKRRMKRNNSYMANFLNYSEFGLARICRNWLIYNFEKKSKNDLEGCEYGCWRNKETKYQKNNIIFFTCQKCRQKDAIIMKTKKNTISVSNNKISPIEDVGDPWYLQMRNYFYPRVHSFPDLRQQPTK